MITVAKRGVLYARFSPRRNAELCESCEHQLARLREYCEHEGIGIVGEFADEALSGGDALEDRPGMFDAASAAKKGDLFIVTAWDRLFRDVEKGLVFRTMLERKGVTIVSATEPATNDDSPLAKLMRTLALAFAEYERELTRARTRAAMLRRQANGQRMSYHCPFGMMRNPNDPSRMVVCRQEQNAIQAIRLLWDTGTKNHHAIARIMNQRGSRRRGKPWDHRLVGTILRRLGETR
jgi:DNA invertase Pin-like site-specific DNA recombinase